MPKKTETQELTEQLDRCCAKCKNKGHTCWYCRLGSMRRVWFESKGEDGHKE